MFPERVLYFGENDWCYGMGLERIEKYNIPSFDEISINDAIEYYQIERYFSDGARSKDWNDNEYNGYKKKSYALYKLCLRFFNSISSKSIVKEYESVISEYHSAFWELFNKCSLYESISDNAFEEIINSGNIPPHDIFDKKAIVDRYGEILKKYILSHFGLIRIVISAYEQDHSPRKKLYLPEPLTPEETVEYISLYIDSDDANYHELESIMNMSYSNRFPITDEIRLKAKKRIEQIIENIPEENKVSFGGVAVTIEEDQDEEIKGCLKGTDLYYSYSKKWLLDTLDFPSILNNFIYIFEFADYRQMRSTLTNKSANEGAVEKIHKSDLDYIYNCNALFKIKNRLAQLQMHRYYQFLLDNDIRIEDVLHWFFTSYLQKEFNCPEIRISFPSRDSSYLEKCSTICSAFDSIIKQFSVFVRTKEIDFELINMSSGSEKYEQVKSLVDGKYIYGIGKEYEWLTHVMFSDQCTFAFVKRIYDLNHSYSSFYDLLLNEDVYLSDYRENERPSFFHLKEKGLISIGSNERISLGEKTKTLILKDLFDNGVISRRHFSNEFDSAFEEWIDEGILNEGNTLLSKQESDYFNFILNHSKFRNGFDLRNKYSHGNQQVVLNENEHKSNYYIFLVLFVTLAIKINDDFCLFMAIKDQDDKQ